MKPTLLLAALLLASTSVAVAATAQHDYDADTDFSAYKTFQWMETDTASDGSTTSYVDSPMVRKRIQSALEVELRKDGLVESEDGQPDIFVVFHATIKDKVQLDTTYGYAPGYRRHRRYPVAYGVATVRTYEEGTLIVDIIDARKNELVWRGWVSDAVGNPKKMETRINKAVKKLFKRFPPAEK